jgi:hypothetical protein
MATDQSTLKSNVDEDFMRECTLPVEDWPWDMRAAWRGGFRWFRSPNIVPIERYRQRRTGNTAYTKPLSG